MHPVHFSLGSTPRSLVLSVNIRSQQQIVDEQKVADFMSHEIKVFVHTLGSSARKVALSDCALLLCLCVHAEVCVRVCVCTRECEQCVTAEDESLLASVVQCENNK